jgi:uncharacterized protein YqeY
LSEISLQKKIDEDLTAAMLRKDALTVKILRFTKSFIDAAAKEKKATLSDEEAVKVLQRRIKQSQDAKEKFLQGNREELAAAEQQEIDLIGRYLPTQLPEAELVEEVKKAIAELNATSPKDLGRVMGKAMAALAGRADGKAVKAAAEKLLAGGN